MANQDMKDGAMFGVAFATSFFALITLPKVIIYGRHCIITQSQFLTWMELIVILFVTTILYLKVWRNR